MIDGDQDFAAFEAAQDATPAPAAEEQRAANYEAATNDEEAAVQDEDLDETLSDVAPTDEAKKVEWQSKNQARINKLTREAKDAEREAKYFRDLYEGRAQAPQAPAQAPQPPDPNAYDLGDMDPRYQEALVDFRVEQKLSAAGLDKLDEKVAQTLQRQAGARVWEARQDEARAEFADYDRLVTEGAEKREWPLSDAMGAELIKCDAGARIAYHLASNPEEAHRIYRLPINSQLRELGRLQAMFDTAPKTPAKTTNAPKPPQGQARGAGGHFVPNAATTNFAEFEALANRKKG